MIIEKVRELKVEVRQFLTKKNERYPDRVPVPFRTMYGYTTTESTNGIYMVLKGKAEPSDSCMRCGRKITHPISLQFGLGSECINHVPGAVPIVNEEDLESYIKELSYAMGEVIWEGWLPKAHISWSETGNLIEPFGKEVKQESKEKESKSNGRIYPQLSEEQELLVERVRLAYLDNPENPKPIEIWIDNKGIVKLVFDYVSGIQVSYKIMRDGGTPLKTGNPYPPKYSKIHDITYTVEVEAVEVKQPKEEKVDEELVNALAEELKSLYN